MKDYTSFKAKDILGKRSCKKGEIILTSEPFAYVLNNQCHGQYCDNCLASSRDKTFMCCKGCGFVWYCNDMCRFAGSEIHQEECKALKRLHPYVPPSFVLLVARVLRKLKNGNDKMEFYTAKKGRRFKDLMNHYTDIKDDENRMKEVRSLMTSLKKLLGEDNFPNESDFIGIYGRIYVNRFCLSDTLMSPIGTAVYLSGSIFDHSCIPNAYPSFIGKKLVIRSLVDWPELDYNKIFISYVDIVSTTNQRRADLKANWYFWCYCPLCVCSERQLLENCIICENPFCGAHIKIPEKPLSIFQTSRVINIECKECGCEVNADTISEYQSALAFTRQRLKGLKEDNPSLQTCHAIVEKQGNLFSSMNVWRVRTIDFFFNAAYYRGMWATCLTNGKENLKGMRYYYGDGHPSLGLFLMKLGKVTLYLKMYREGLNYLDEAEEILITALGKDHPLVEDEIPRLRAIANEDLDILFERREEARKQKEHELVCKHCGNRKRKMAAARWKEEEEEEEEVDLDWLMKRIQDERAKLARKLQGERIKVGRKPKENKQTEQGKRKKEESKEEVKENGIEEEGSAEPVRITKNMEYKINGHIDYSTNAKYLKFLFPVK